MQEEKEERGFHLEKSISVGHILTTLSLIISAIMWTTSIEKKLATQDAQIVSLQETDRIMRQEAYNAKTEIIIQLKSINEKLDRSIENRRK